MKMSKRVLSVVISAALIFVFLLTASGCGQYSAAQYRFSVPEKYDKLKTTCVAENERYSLIWNAESSRIVLYDKVVNREWSYVPNESLSTRYDAEGYELNNHPKTESPIIVNFYDPHTLVDSDTNAYAQSISKGNFTLEKIDNGVEMKIYFEKYSFTIPVRFVLVDDGVEITVDTEHIEENDDFCISKITVAPFFCSISNDNVGKDNYYMFVPSGSGTIIEPVYTDGLGTIYTETVYGGDQNLDSVEYTTPVETVRTPVYGVVNGDTAVCAVIKSGAEFSAINTSVCQNLTGYSHVESEFRVRGYQQAIQSLFTSSVVNTKLYADAFAADPITIGFYPLYGEDASYVGMANKYREKLEDENLITAEKSEDTLLNLKMVGGIQTKKFVFGIPSGDMLVATTVDEAREILEDIKASVDAGKINMNLIGFGGSGNDIGSVAGGAKLGKYFGSAKDLKELSEFCKSNDADLYMNFDMVRFSKSGLGVSTTFGKADASNGSFTAKHYFKVNFRTVNNDFRTFFLARRGKLNSVADKVKDAADKYALQGVSLDTLTSYVYSDYSEKQFYSGSNMVEQVKDITSTFTDGGLKVAGSEANGFVAGLCSHVYDAPTSSTRLRFYTEDVPFYQIVFKGRTSMSGTSLNLATDKEKQLLKAYETGMGLTYTLIKNYDTNLITSAQNVFYGSVYWDDVIERGVKDDIVKTVGEYKKFFDSVNGVGIKSNEIVAPDVHKTVFENGVTVYVNYSNKDFETADGTVKALGCIVK